MMDGWKRLRRPVAAGALASLGLWLWDVLSLGQLSFAGASDAEVQNRVVGAASGAILSLELQLALVHVVFGVIVGVLTHFFLRAGGRWLGWRVERPGWIAAGVVLLAETLALLGMVGHYPQLFADRWWLSGSLAASLQRVVTHTIGPLVFDTLLLALGATLATGAGLELLASPLATLFEPSRRSRFLSFGKWLLPAVAVLVVATLAAGRRTVPTDAPPDVLILASDSLRTDRLESADVMPFASSLAAKGSLFRYAFTPIARTYPSWVSTLTGTEPRRHDVRHMFPRREPRESMDPSFFTELRDEGYFTFVVSDFAGDVFHGFEGGFELVDTPALNVDTLVASTVLSAHRFALSLLRLRWARQLFPVWRNLPSLADPQWLVEEALAHIDAARDRPYAGLVFFSTAHFPYAAPYPYYLREAGEYEGPYLYHVPPDQAGKDLDAEDIRQLRARYDGALAAIDAAMSRLYREASSGRSESNRLVVVTGDHGEELYEIPGIGGHGDIAHSLASQAVPILLQGPRVPAGRRDSSQVRLYDLGATILDLTIGSRKRGETPRRFGQGVNLFAEGEPRPICVESGIWFWPTLPAGLVGQRLDYAGIAELLELLPTREMALRRDMEALVETSKERGLVLGNEIWSERFTPRGLEMRLFELPRISPRDPRLDLKARFESRCVADDPELSRVMGAVVFRRETDQDHAPTSSQ